ncbi:tetratricopeptide repeat protein [Leptotrichia shahii]|uniref:tetratricopeptide repeat protein n=1 Tax=Leptotrichia shahii TaxID=157691 RepID=UPI0028D1351E|nr:tetratricopeptide repeat protein [Leptotrichia shahii]
MKRKIMLVVVILAIGMMSVSCFNKKKDKKKNTQTQQQQSANINTDIFNLGGQAQGNPNIKNLSPEEQQNLIDNQIDPSKVSEALTKAQNGDKEAIMSLAQLYYNLKNMDKVKQILQYGVDRNYPEAMYNLAVILKQEGNTAEANKLIARLPRGAVTSTGGAGVAGGQRVRQIRMRPGAEAYNRGVDLIKAKRYKEAKIEFEKAYNAGIKEADIRVALLNKELKNDSEAVKWFQKAANRGVKEANYEIGAILYDGGKQSESRPYLLKAYNSGNKALAMPIAMSYHQQNNMSEALKWYKIAAKNGDKNAAATVERIEKGGVIDEKKSNEKRVKTFLGNNNSSQSLTESTLNDVKSKNKAEESIKTETKPEESQPKAQTAKPSEKSSEINIDEIMKKKAAEYNK